MDDFFNFSFPDFGSFFDSLSFDNTEFNLSGEQTGDIVQTLAGFALNQALGNGSRNPAQQLLNQFARQAAGSLNSPRSSSGPTTFQASRGQSAAQLAALIARAKRNL